MHVFNSSKHKEHEIEWEIFNGEKEESAEKPQRIDSILKELTKNHYIMNEVFNQQTLLELVKRVHTKDYIEFLQSVKDSKFKKLYPSVRPYGNNKVIQLNPHILAGKYLFDTFTPFTHNIFEVALNSSNLALSSSQYSLDNNTVSYALCRPPGHHATKNLVGGYCYLANASIVAEYVLSLGLKPCILDIDYHHGNGAQEIWYDSNKVLTISIHRETEDKFPYYSGDAEEKGKEQGLNYNLNLPLKAGAHEDIYLQTLQKALQKIKENDINFVIVSAGFDTYKLDPLGDFKLEIDSYKKIASEIAKLNLPTTILQEGGYHLDDLGKCVSSFLSGF